MSKSLLEVFGSKFLFGELESERYQDRAGRRVSSTAERDNEATAVAFSQVVKEGKGDRAGELLFFAEGFGEVDVGGKMGALW